MKGFGPVNNPTKVPASQSNPISLTLTRKTCVAFVNLGMCKSLLEVLFLTP